jgi:DNA-binding protein Fis
MKKRYYFHGDKIENSDLYYCAKCDMEKPHIHFHQNYHTNNISDYNKYLSTKRTFKRMKKDNYYRPHKQADLDNIVN